MTPFKLVAALLGVLSLSSPSAAQERPHSPPPAVQPVVGCNYDGCLVVGPEGEIYDGWRFSASSAPGTGSYGWWERFSEQPAGTYFIAQLCNGTSPYDDNECGPASATYRVPSRPRWSANWVDPGVIREAFAERGASTSTQDFAVQVARCESGLNPSATNGQYLGLFQMGRYHYHRFNGGAWSDAWVNARAAADLWAEQGWRPWECA